MKQTKKTWSALQWICSETGIAKLYIVLLIIAQALCGAGSVAYALFLRVIVNAAVAGERAGFYKGIAGFTSLIIVQLLLRALCRYLDELSRSTIENRLKVKLFRELFVREYERITAVHSGEWMNRLTSDVTVVADNMTQILPGVLEMAVKLLGAIGAILWLEPRFLYILIPGGVLLLLTATVFRESMKRLHRDIRENDGRLRIFLSERLSSMLVVRTFAQEERSVQQAETFMQNHKNARMKRNHFSNLCNFGFGVAMNGLYVLGVFFCGYGILAGTMTYGNLMAVMQLVSQIQSPFANITGYFPKYYAMLASAERLMEVEEFRQDVPALKEVSFEEFGLLDAYFTYETEEGDKAEVLSGFTLKIKRGEYVAFTGPSGCGKSTVLKLLMALYTLNAGERYLLFDGKKEALTGLHRSLFAYVPQGNQLMTGTIREVVAFGDPDKMQQEELIWQALRMACAEEFVKELESGLDTLLGERGSGLSEGQMQRIAIARAIFSDRPVLMLDEATSALDEATAQRLLDNIRTMTDRTVIMVTHRTANMRIFDREVTFSKDGMAVINQNSGDISE